MVLKKIKFLCFFSFLILFLGSCGSSDKEQDKGKVVDLHQIKERGRIVAITDYNSTNYFIYRGTPMGFQYEMLRNLADDLDVELDIKVSNDLEENFNCLNTGRCNLIALNLTVTKERSKQFRFTVPILQTHQVLIQRKPENWRQMTRREVNLGVIRNQLELAGKTIYVQENSAHAERLRNLSDEIGDSIDIVEVPMVVEELIKLVADGEIDYTVCDENVAKVNKSYYKNIDVQTAISFPQYIAWAVDNDSEKLLAEINEWIVDFKKTLKYRLVYNKYFENTRSAKRMGSEYYAINSGKISAFDPLIKQYSTMISWDWRLLASLIYQESRFNPNVKSWAGAFGLMQLMPATAEIFGVDTKATPEQNIKAGVQFIEWLDERFKDRIPDEKERIKFILASYNVGLGHVLDARRLAEKYGKNPDVWEDNVDYFVLNKSKPGFYKDPVVNYGYCRGEEPYHYVQEILERYEHYKNIIQK